MTSTRRPPTFMPGMPWSQPWMTWPWPIVNSNGLLPLVPRGVELLAAVEQRADVLDGDLVAVLGLGAGAGDDVGALQLLRRGAGGLAGTVGFLFRSVLTPMTFFCSGSGSPGWRALTVDFVDARSAGSVVDGSPSILEPSLRKPSSLPPPQPAARPRGKGQRR